MSFLWEQYLVTMTSNLSINTPLLEVTILMNWTIVKTKITTIFIQYICCYACLIWGQTQVDYNKCIRICIHVYVHVFTWQLFVCDSYNWDQYIGDITVVRSMRWISQYPYRIMTILHLKGVSVSIKEIRSFSVTYVLKTFLWSCG